MEALGRAMIKNSLNTLFFCLLPCSITVADEYHFNNLLIGKNAVGLGGAFTAVADDLSAIHYNPAGLVNVEQGNMASINTFAWDSTSFEGVLSNGNDFERDAFSVVPGFFGFKYTGNDWHIGAAFIVKDYSQERSEINNRFDLPPSPTTPFPTEVNEFASIDIENSAYQIKFSAAQSFNDNWSFGIGLGAELNTIKSDQVLGSVNRVLVSEEQSLSTGFQASARFLDENWIVEPSLSVFYKERGLSFGAKLSKPWVLSRNHSLTGTVLLTGIPPQTPGILTAFTDTEEACCKQQFPVQLATGIAYELKNWQVSFDAKYYLDVNQQVQTLDELGRNITLDFEPTLNLALGLKYAFSPSSVLRLGIFSDNATSEIDTSVAFQRLEVIDLVGLSVSYETRVADFPIAFGVYTKYGDGLVRLSDTRASERTVGIPLRPVSDNFDIADATKRTIVAFFSIDF